MAELGAPDCHFGEPRSTFEPVMKELEKRKMSGEKPKLRENGKNDNVAQAKAVFKGETVDPTDDEKSASGSSKEEKFTWKDFVFNVW